MKKPKLNLDGVKNMLTRDEMKKISGGYTPLACHCRCETDLGFTSTVIFIDSEQQKCSDVCCNVSNYRARVSSH